MKVSCAIVVLKILYLLSEEHYIFHQDKQEAYSLPRFPSQNIQLRALPQQAHAFECFERNQHYFLP